MGPSWACLGSSWACFGPTIAILRASTASGLSLVRQRWGHAVIFEKNEDFLSKTSIKERTAQPLTKAPIAARFQTELQNERASTAEEEGSPHVAQNHATKTLVSR